MMKRRVLIGVFALLFLVNTAKAQADDAFNNMYMTFELGASRGYQNFGQLGLTLQLEQKYWRLRVATAYDNSVQVKVGNREDDNCNCTDERGIVDFGIIHGRSLAFWKRHQFQFGAGISFVIRTEPDDVFNRQKRQDEFARFMKSRMVGLPVETRYQFQFKRHFALTVTTYANVNPLKTYAGISGGFAIGMF